MRPCRAAWVRPSDTVGLVPGMAQVSRSRVRPTSNFPSCGLFPPTHAFVGLRLLPPDRIARQVRPIHVGKALKAQGPLGLSSRVLGGTEPLDYKFQEARGTDDLAPVVDAEKLADFASNEVLGHVIHPAFFYDRFPIGAESFEAVS